MSTHKFKAPTFLRRMANTVFVKSTKSDIEKVKQHLKNHMKKANAVPTLAEASKGQSRNLPRSQ